MMAAIGTRSPAKTASSTPSCSCVLTLASQGFFCSFRCFCCCCRCRARLCVCIFLFLRLHVGGGSVFVCHFYAWQLFSHSLFMLWSARHFSPTRLVSTAWSHIGRVLVFSLESCTWCACVCACTFQRNTLQWAGERGGKEKQNTQNTNTDTQTHTHTHTTMPSHSAHSKAS